MIEVFCVWEEHKRRPHYKHTVLELLEHVYEREHRIMASLDNLQATLDKLVADEQTAAADVAQAFADLQALIGTLQAGTITQDQIDALTTQAQSVDDSITALDAAAKAAEPQP